jgi:hypothetical protein
MPKGFHASHNQTRSYTDSYQRLSAKSFKKLLDAKLGNYTFEGIKQSKEHCQFELIAADEWPRAMIFTINNKKIPVPLQTDNRSASNKLYLVCPYCVKQRQYLYASKSSYICRECLKIHYRCQSESKIDRLARRIRKERAQIWGYDWPDRYNLMECSMWWPKPKGLHNDKFDKAKTELYKLEQEYDHLSNIKLARMFGI